MIRISENDNCGRKKGLILIAPLLLATLVLAACSGSAKIAQGDDASAGVLTPNSLTSASVQISAQTGGYVNVGSAQLKIPALAIDQDTEITAEVVDIALPAGGAQAIGKGIRLKPEGLQFLVPAELEICYGANDAANLNASQAMIYYQSHDQGFVGIAGNVDVSRRCVKSPIEHFSSYVAAAYAVNPGNTAPQFAGINFLPATPTPGVPLRVRVQINDVNGGATPGHVVAATLTYSFDGGATQLNLPLVPDATDDTVTNRYFAEIPANQVSGTAFSYAITAVDNLNASRRTPTAAGTFTSVAMGGAATAIRFNPATFTAVAPLQISAGFSRQLALQVTSNGTTWQNISAENVVSLSSASLGSIIRIAPSSVRFNAVGAGSGQIIANVGSLSTSAYVNVAPGLLTHIEITDVNQVIISGTGNLAAGQTYDFDVIGFDSYGNIASVLPAMSTTGGIGTVSVDLTGLHFTASAAAGSGSIIATLAGLTDSISLNLYVAPQVTATAPFDNTAGIALNASVGVTFSQVMDTSTLTTGTTSACTGTLQVSSDEFVTCVPMASATPSFYASNTLAVIQPAANLLGNTTYKIRVTAAARNTLNQPLVADYTAPVGFTTVAAPVSGIIGRPDITYGGPLVPAAAIISAFEGQPGGGTIDASDNLYVSGYMMDTSSTKHLILLKLTPSGQLDFAFAGTGIYTESVAPQSSGGGVAIDSMGRILVTGEVRDLNGTAQAAVWRLLPNGTLDTSFGASGVYVHPLGVGGLGGRGVELAIDATGRTVVAATDDEQLVLFRLTPTGSLDTSFGTAGVTIAPSAYPRNEPASIKFNPMGEIFISGSYVEDPSSSSWDTSAALWKFNSSGVPDTSFGTSGVFRFGSAGQRQVGYDFVIEPSGRMLMAGIDFVSGGLKAMVIAVSANGTIDSTYASGGVLILNSAPGSVAFAFGAMLDANGRLLITGDQLVPALGATVWRINPSGAPDMTFANGTGVAVFNGVPALLGRGGLDSQGRVLTGGHVNDGNGGFTADTIVVVRFD